MKYAARMLAIAVTMVPLLASAQWGQSNKVVAQVPFQFRAGNQIIPAGECTVQAGSTFGNSLLVRNWEAKAGQFTMPVTSQTATPSATTALVFHKYGERYFLAGVKVKGSQIVYLMPEGKAESELRAQNIPASQEVLLARLK
jgi:hypothetical protein